MTGKLTTKQISPPTPPYVCVHNQLQNECSLAPSLWNLEQW